MSEQATPEQREAERYPQIVRAIRDTPWAMLESAFETMIEVVSRRLDGDRLSDEEIKARVGNRPSSRPTDIVGSVAVIPIYGAIIPKATVFSEMSGGTSIQGLQSDFRAALASEDVKSIVFDIDSPGGMTSGVPELAAEIRAARGQKPIVAVSNFRAASAAYWLGAQADEFVASPSSDVGSIGVFAAHRAVAGMEEKMGVRTTLIAEPPGKIEGNPFAELTAEAEEHLREMVGEAYATFVGDLAAGRGISADTVKADYGGGRVLTAAKALKAGMVDRVDTLESVVARLQNPSGRTRVTNGNVTRRVAITFTGSGAGLTAGPISPHSTATTDSAWDGPANKANLKNDNPASFRQAFAWFDGAAADPDGDGYPDNKGDYKFIHHEVGSDGAVGAANLNGCSQGIAVLNGGRGGANIPEADRKGVWNHLAKHLRDGGKEPPPLKGAEEDARLFTDDVDEALRAFDSVVSRAEALRALTGTKREQLAALVERGKGLLATQEETQDESLSEAEIEFELAAVDLRLRGL